jgi:WD repeat-containing protein 61
LNFLFTAHSDEIWAVAWTANNTALSASADGTVKQWDSTSGQVTMSRPPHNLAIVSLSVSPDGKFALYNGLDGTTQLWDLQPDTIVGRRAMTVLQCKALSLVSEWTLR